VIWLYLLPLKELYGCHHNLFISYTISRFCSFIGGIHTPLYYLLSAVIMPTDNYVISTFTPEFFFAVITCRLLSAYSDAISVLCILCSHITLSVRDTVSGHESGSTIIIYVWIIRLWGFLILAHTAVLMYITLALHYRNAYFLGLSFGDINILELVINNIAFSDIAAFWIRQQVV
jgi:hypothetical protein